jgi:hypothetical protein
VYSGDGSTTAFTLEHSVGADEDILVSVDGVIQEPSVAYAVSSGTTLTFTAAPSTNSGNNIFVYYLFRTVGTIDHPATSALTATSGTFSTDLTVDTSTLKVDSTNNRIGVGTASPSSSLHIRTADSSATAESNAAVIIEGTDATRADLQFLGDAGAFQAIYFGDNSDADIGRIAYSHSGNSMRFNANASESMRILSNGGLCVNRTDQANSERLAITGNSSSQCMSLTSPITGAYDMMNIINGNGQVGRIGTDGSATQFVTSSDYRLKENVTTSWDATTRLKQLKPSRFNFIADADTTVDGFLAHEVSSIVPEAISGDKDGTEDITNVVLNADGTVNSNGVSQADWTSGKSDETYANDTTWVASKTVPKYQGIDQSKLVPLLVKTIQELEARITALESA